MKFIHTHRHGAALALIDLVTFGLFFLFYLPPVEQEIRSITQKDFVPYWKVFLLGLLTLIIPNIVWISFRAEELKQKALELGIEGKLTSFQHMFIWNLFFMWTIIGPMIATQRFFDTLNQIEEKLNQQEAIHG